LGFFGWDCFFGFLCHSKLDIPQFFKIIMIDFDINSALTCFIFAPILGFGAGTLLVLFRHVTHHFYEKYHVTNWLNNKPI
jgi:hypothetical protein